MNEGRVCIVECIGVGTIISRIVYLYDENTDSELVVEAAEQEFRRLCQKHLGVEDEDELNQAVIDRHIQGLNYTVSMSFEDLSY